MTVQLEIRGTPVRTSAVSGSMPEKVIMARSPHFCNVAVVGVRGSIGSSVLIARSNSNVEIYDDL